MMSADELGITLAAAGYPWDVALADTSDNVEHVWLQAKADGTTWLDLDATSADGAPACTPERFHTDLPDEMAHRVAISVVAETRTDGQLAQGELLRLERQMADLATSRIAFAFGEPAGLLEATTETGFGLNPDPAAGLTSYTPLLRIDGETFAGTAVAFPALSAFVADEIDDALGGAMDLFDSLPGAEDVASRTGTAGTQSGSAADGITAIWLDVELLHPGGETTWLRIRGP